MKYCSREKNLSKHFHFFFVQYEAIQLKMNSIDPFYVFFLHKLENNLESYLKNVISIALYEYLWT